MVRIMSLVRVCCWPCCHLLLLCLAFQWPMDFSVLCLFAVYLTHVLREKTVFVYCLFDARSQREDWLFTVYLTYVLRDKTSVKHCDS